MLLWGYVSGLEGTEGFSTADSCGSPGDLCLNTIIANIFKCAVESSGQTNQEPINRSPVPMNSGVFWYFMNSAYWRSQSAFYVYVFRQLASKLNIQSLDL